MLNGLQLITIPIDHKWKPFAVITRIREIIESQNSTHVFIGVWTVNRGMSGVLVVERL